MTQNININKTLILLIDVMLFALSYAAAFFIRFGFQFPTINEYEMFTILPYFIVVFIVFCLIYDFYSEYEKYDDRLVSLICIIVLTTTVNLALSFLFRHFAIPRLALAFAALIQFFLLSIWRYIVWIKALLVQQPKSALIVGYPSEIKNIMETINVSLGRGLRIEKELRLNEKDIFLERWRDLSQQTIMNQIKVIIICSSVKNGGRRKIMDYCIQNGIEVMLVPDLYDIMLQKAKLVSAGDIPIIQLGGLLSSSPRGYVKRFMDIILSSLAILVLLPVGFLTALAIKIDSKGPVFYSQTRLGVRGKKFNVYKFRTMINNAEQITGPVVASENDSRITRVGKVLRQIRLDEIPQFWNVLIGDMSLVGPRPERPHFVDQYSEELPEFRYRHNVKGGITGLAQVEGRYSTDPDKKLAYDLIYAQNNSILADLVLLLRTAKVLMQKGKAS